MAWDGRAPGVADGDGGDGGFFSRPRDAALEGFEQRGYRKQRRRQPRGEEEDDDDDNDDLRRHAVNDGGDDIHRERDEEPEGIRSDSEKLWQVKARF